MRRTLVIGAVAAVLGCGGGGSYGGGGTVSGASADGGGGTTPGGYVITISNLAFSPVDLAVPPGATVTVVNRDGMPHSVTSEPRSGAYTRGAPAGVTPFDTGEFSSGQRTFTVGASTPAGTVIPYYCTVHTTTMATPNGTIRVDPNATPAGTTGSPGADAGPSGIYGSGG